MSSEVKNGEPLPVPASGAASGTSLGVLILVMTLTIGPLIALSQVIAWWRTDVVDDQMFGYYGWRILHGATVYVDVWDNKPPGIYWVNALGMLVGNDNYGGVMAMCVLALVVAHVAFFVVASSVYHRSAAALATIFLSFYLTHAYYTGGTNRTETFLVACELAGMAFYMRGFARDRWWKWYAAGLCCGLAFLFKQVGLAAWGCMGLHLIALGVLRQLNFATVVKRGGLLAGGAATTVGVAAGVLAAQGALWEAVFATFGFNRSYMATGDTQFPYSYKNLLLEIEHVQLVLVLPLLMAAAAALHAVLWFLRPRYRPPEIEKPLMAIRPVCRLSFGLFALWFLVAFYGVLLSPSRFRHYLVATIPPLILMAGYLINVLRAETKLLRRLQQRAWVAAAFVVLAYFSWDALGKQFEEVSRVIVDRMFQQQAAEWEAVGDAVARHTDPGDTIQCWGYMPGVYLRARRINATRFTTMEKVGQVGAGANFVVQEVERVMHTTPPVAIAMSAGDYLWLHGIHPDGTASQFTLGPWLDENYQLVEDVPRFNVLVFKRRDKIEPDHDQNLDAYRDEMRTEARRATELKSGAQGSSSTP